MTFLVGLWVPTCLCCYQSEVKSLSRVWLFATPWTHQAPPSMGFSRQEYWSGLPLLSPGNLSHPGIERRSPILQADALTSEPAGKPCWHQGPNKKHLKPPQHKTKSSTTNRREGRFAWGWRWGWLGVAWPGVKELKLALFLLLSY